MMTINITIRCCFDLGCKQEKMTTNNVVTLCHFVKGYKQENMMMSSTVVRCHSPMVSKRMTMNNHIARHHPSQL
jgi:hypothetical protein